jgi:hypothetical protein
MKEPVDGDGVEQRDPGESPAPGRQRGHPLADLVTTPVPEICATDPAHGEGEGKKREEEERRNDPENEIVEREYYIPATHSPEFPPIFAMGVEQQSSCLSVFPIAISERSSTSSIALIVPFDLPAPVKIVIRHKTIIIAIHQGRGDHEIGGGPIAGNGNIPNYRHSQERLDIRVMGLRFQRIPEKDEKIDLTLGYFGADLLIPAQRPTLELGDLEAKLLFQYFPSCACCINLMVSQ